jgi:hypothetical protein
MKKLNFAAVFLLPFFFLLAGCDNSSPTGIDEPKKGIDPKLVGNWECYKTVTAGIAQEFPEGARMEISFTSDGSYNFASTNVDGTWRTSNDSLYLTSSINNVEVFYALYEISGSDVIFNIAGNKQYYKKAGVNEDPEDPYTPVNIEKQNLYGKWTCYQVIFDEDGEEFVWSEEDEDWESMELSFSATQAKMTSEGETLETSTWYIQNGTIIIEVSEEDIYAFKIVSFDNGILALGEEDAVVMYLKKS